MNISLKIKQQLILILVIIVSSYGQKYQRLDINGNPIITDSNLKQEYKKGELMIRFRSGELDSISLESDSISFEGTQLTKRNSVKTKILEKLRNLNAFRNADKYELRRAVKRLRPHHKHSLSRSGKSVPIPDLYNLMVMKVSDNTDIPKLCEELSLLEGVAYAEPNYLIKLDDTPATDPDYATQQKSLEQSNDIDIDVARAWDFSTGSPSIKVGIIDNGVDYHNIDLGDGAFGYSGAKVRSGWDYINNDGDPDYTDDPNYSHGTEVAGIIGAFRNNSEGVAGIAGGNPGNIGVQLYAFKVGPTVDDPRGIDIEKAVDAIIEASVLSGGYGYGCDILNSSWGLFTYDYSLHGAVSVAAENNVVFVSAKGNSGSTSSYYPADFDNPWVIAVGATGVQDSRVVNEDGYISNYGGGIDVGAPGVASMVYTTTAIEGIHPYRHFNGTSASTPHVAGLASLILSSSLTSLHSEDVQGIIRASADKVRPDLYTYDWKGWNTNVGYGRINSGRALEIVNGYNGWAFTRDFVYSGTSVGESNPYYVIMGRNYDQFIAIRHDVRKTINLPVYQQTYVWGRGANESNGWSASNPNYMVGFCGVASTTPLTAELQSYVYELWSYPDAETYYGWYPCEPNEVSFSYTILGKPHTININSSGNVNLTWDAFPTSALQYYEVWRNINIWGWNCIATTTNTSFVDNEFEITAPRWATDQVQYRMRTKATNNAYSPYSNIVSSQGVSYYQQKISKPVVELPQEFSLAQNFPNPFNPTTEIAYNIKEPVFVTLKVFNSLGQEVVDLVNETQQPGFYSLKLNASKLPSGIYYYVIQAGNFNSVKKMILMK